MTCRICLRGTCTESFHSLGEQNRYEEVLDKFNEADDIKDTNKRRITELEQQIQNLQDEIESAYETAREYRINVNN